jgi:AraC-like DNA-binding protein
MKTTRPRCAPAPIERGALQWRHYGKPYRDVLYLYWPMTDRARWIKRAAWNDLCVFSCGWYVEAHGHFWERQRLIEGVFIYCTAGKGFYRQGGREWTILPGDLLYCPPLSHHSYGADPRNPWTIFWMHVSGPGIVHCRDLFGFTPAQPVRQVGIRPRAIAAFRALFHLMQPPLTDARMAALSHGARFALARLALETGEETASEAIGAGVQCVADYMEAHVAEAANLPVWLKLFGGSRSHFQRQFKRATGCAPNDYFLRLKIRKACGLLATSSLRIAEIADRVGMADPYYFSRQFRRVTGSSPRAYRLHIAQHEAATS